MLYSSNDANVMRIGAGGESLDELNSSSLATLLRICDLTIDVPLIQSIQFRDYRKVLSVYFFFF